MVSLSHFCSNWDKSFLFFTAEQPIDFKGTFDFRNRSAALSSLYWLWICTLHHTFVSNQTKKHLKNYSLQLILYKLSTSLFLQYAFHYVSLLLLLFCILRPERYHPLRIQSSISCFSPSGLTTATSLLPSSVTLTSSSSPISKTTAVPSKRLFSAENCSKSSLRPS